jgi:hypothetical protein
MTDVVTPCFETRRAEGRIINNPMSSHTISHQATSWSSWTDTYNTRHPTGLFNDMWLMQDMNHALSGAWLYQKPTVETAANSDIAVNAAYADVAGNIAMALVDLAEAHKTMQMFAMILEDARRLRKRTLMWLKGDGARRAYARYSRDMRTLPGIYRRVGGVASGASSYWLQWRYGWNPLLMSIVDTAHAATAQTGKNIRLTGRGASAGSNSGMKIAHYTQNPLWWMPGTTPIPFKSCTVSIDLQERYRAGVLAELTLTRAHALGLSALDIPNAAWELVPYSFVVDWFVKVGDWIQAWSPQLDMKVRAAWLVLESEKITTYGTTVHPRTQHAGTGDSYVSFVGTGSADSYVDIERRVSRSVNPKRSSLPPLDMNPFMSYRRILDAIALGYQTFGRSTGNRPKRR